MVRDANKQVAYRARMADRTRRGLMNVDLGGGGGRVGSRENCVKRPSKCDLLRPQIERDV